MRLSDYIGKYWAGAEVMYGVIIAMSFTSVLRGQESVLEQLVYTTITTALLCCIAWGIADGLFYSWERRFIIRQENEIIQFSKSAQENESAITLIGNQLDDTILRNIHADNRHQLYQRLVEYLSKVDVKESLTGRDTFIIVGGTFLRSAGAGLIIIIPFLIIDNIERALDISNLFGILLLFIVGYFRSLERTFFSKIISAFGSAFIGIIITIVTVVMGG
jgi:VIT1/CCC1 family predicted Fe2+/Mn2+ transporter